MRSRASWSKSQRKDILAEIRASNDLEFKRDLLESLKTIKPDSGDLESKSGSEKEEGETSELAEDAITESTAVNSTSGME